MPSCHKSDLEEATRRLDALSDKNGSTESEELVKGDER
jgi:hypothetical protein